MPARRLTESSVEKTKPTADRREIPDSLLPGLYLVVQPSGAKSWAVRARIDRKPFKHTIGPWPRFKLKDARDLARAALRKAAEGIDPTEAKRREDNRAVPTVITNFLAAYRDGVRKRTFTEVRRILRKEVEPKWKRRDIDHIKRADIRALLDGIVDRGAPIQANRVHAVISRLFKWCVEHELIEASPAIGIAQRVPNRARDRVLDAGELVAVWNAADKLGGAPPNSAMPLEVARNVSTAIKLLILLGQRRSEVTNMEWSELDLDAGLWSLPGARCKNGNAHTVPLSPQAVALLKAIRQGAGNPAGDGCSGSDSADVSAGNPAPRYVFGPRGLKLRQRHIDALLELLPADMPHWTLHDIRRSVASGLQKLRVPLPVTEKILNHVSGSFAGVAGIYHRDDMIDQTREALNTWGFHVTALVTGANVVALPKTAA